MSTGFSPLTIAGAVEAAQQFIGPFEILGTTPSQWGLTGSLPAYRRALSSYGDYTYGIAAETAAEINAELERRGFDIRLEEWEPSPLKFGVAGITDVTVNWYTQAEVVAIRPVTGGNYPGFALKAEQMARVIEIGGFREPMVQIQTAEGLEVRIVMTEEPGSQLELMKQARRLHEADASPARMAGSVAHLPMVKLQQQPDISWLIGLLLQGSDGPPWVVAQAAQEVRFAMNQFGARAKEATALGMERAIRLPDPYDPYVVDRPFLVVIGQPDEVEVPLFGAYITPDDWKDPGDLSAL